MLSQNLPCFYLKNRPGAFLQLIGGFDPILAETYIRLVSDKNAPQMDEKNGKY
jgi:hypothetical protein